MICRWICAVGIALAAASASAAGFPAPDALMARLMAADDVPGAAVAVIKDGKVVLEKGYGYRDVATQAPVTTATLFNIGSISKSFTALGVAQLVDRDQVDLDAPVAKYIADFRLSDPEAPRVVTLRQMLSHSSGLPADEEWPQQVPATREAVLAEFATMPITAPPGTRFQYCTRCIVLAAYVLERITGQSWEPYTRAHIFAPLGMTTASFAAAGLEQAPDHALPYHHGQLVPWGRLQYLNVLAPGGGIDASVGEMARYAMLQLGDGAVSGGRVVSAEMLAELHRPEIAVGADWSPSAPAQNQHYALGWFTADVQGAHLIFHNGSNPGFRARIALVPSSKAGVVVLTNAESIAFLEETTRRLLEQLR